jgi:hypothetical protein
VDELGLPLKQATEIEADIHEEFHKSTQGLSRNNHYFMHWGRDDVMSMSVIDKRGWLQDKQLARESQNTAKLHHINNNN